MKKRISKKLVYKFLAFFLPVLIFSIIITGLVLSIISYNFFQITVLRDYRNILQSSAGEIRLFMQNAQNNLESLALLLTATDLDEWRRKMALTAFLHQNSQFVFLSLYSPDKKMLTTTFPKANTLSVPDSVVFDQALGGKSAVSGVMVAGRDLPVIHLAVPVRHQGAIQSVLWAEVNLKSIWDVLSGINIGRNGQVYILDLSGRTIGHRQIDRVIKTVLPENTGIIEALRTADRPVEWIEENEGQQAYNLGVHVKPMDWIVVLSQPRNEIFAYLYRNLFWSVMIILGLCIMAGVFGWIWTRRLLAPIRRLHQQVRLIGQGELDRHVSIDTEDEIGELGLAFNDMADSLKAYIAREVETARALVHAQNLAVLGTASSKVTHEVGNFLNNTDMALAGLKTEALSGRGEKILQILDKESKQVKTFIKRFLQFAKRPDLQIQRRPLAPIIRDVIDVYLPEAGQRNVQFELNWPETLPPVEVDAGLLSQVLHNLMKNSLDAMNGHGVVSITGEVEQGDMVMTVSDSGQGMAEGVRNRIFEPFYTTKGTEGTGLGMAIVKTIVEAHQGTIECFSGEGEGTRFEIRLPLGRKPGP